jgi:hypothetical protein
MPLYSGFAECASGKPEKFAIKVLYLETVFCLIYGKRSAIYSACCGRGDNSHYRGIYDNCLIYHSISFFFAAGVSGIERWKMEHRVDFLVKMELKLHKERVSSEVDV